MPLSLWYLYQYKASIDMYMPHALSLGAGINMLVDVVVRESCTFHAGFYISTRRSYMPHALNRSLSSLV